MSVDEAKARCTQLNKENTFIKDKIRVSAKRVTELKTVDEALFSQALVTSFESLLDDENFGTSTQLQKMKSVFNFVQKLCNALRVLPSEYKTHSKQIYKYLAKQKVSVSYAVRIITMLNRWGRFHSRETGNFYDEVRQPKGNELSIIADAQLTKTGVNSELGVRTESLPMTETLLGKIKSKMTPEQHNWVYLSFWLGLRPSEVDSLKLSTHCKVEFNKKLKVNVISVYQTKLQQVAREKRWKHIPLIFTEQDLCKTIIESGEFNKPLVKTMKKHVGMGYNLYSGRKGFVDMMLDKEQKLENISMWLGHKSIETTWRKYKDKMNIAYSETEETVMRKV